MSDDEYVLRDERGHPLTSIFHKPPIKTWVPKSMRVPTIRYFHPDDYDEEVEGK